MVEVMKKGELGAGERAGRRGPDQLASQQSVSLLKARPQIPQDVHFAEIQSGGAQR
jgi:hypothetical protein